MHDPCSGCLGRRLFARTRLQAGAPQLHDFQVLLSSFISRRASARGSTRCGFTKPAPCACGSQGEGAQGVYGWRAHPAVRAYRAFKRGEAPPEPEAVVLESLSASAGRSELAQLGLHM